MSITENLMASAVGQYLSENISQQQATPKQSKIKKSKKVKQELAAVAENQDEDSPKAYPNGRKRASKACYECQRRHTRCGFGRPCERCIRLGLQCVDVQSVKKRGRAQKKSEFMDTNSPGEQAVTTVSSASPSSCSPPVANHFCHTPNHFLHQQDIHYQQLPHEVSCNKLDITQDDSELLDCSEDYESRMFSTILNDPILPPPSVEKIEQPKPQQQPQQPQMNQQAKSALEQLLSALLFNNNPTITSTLSMSQQQQPTPVPSLVTSILDIINQKHTQPQPQPAPQAQAPSPVSQPLPQTPLFETPSPSTPAENTAENNNILSVIETQMVDSVFRKNGVDPESMLGAVSDLHLFFPRPYEFAKNIETCVTSNLFANDNMGVIISTDVPNMSFVSNSIVSKLGYSSSKDMKTYYDVFLPVQMNGIVQDIKEDRERRMSILASATTGGEILRTKYSITEHKTRSLVMDKSGSIMEFVHKYYRVYNINNPCKLEGVYSFLYWM